jgi:hypothetical protein
MRKNKIFLLLISSCLVLVGISCNKTFTAKEGETITLSGSVYPEDHWGPPNYGENPGTDSRERAYILRLDHPMEYRDGSRNKTTVREVHLIPLGNIRVDVNPHQKFTGVPECGTISPHHYRHVIFVVKEN